MESVLQPPPPFCFEKDLANITSGNLSREWSKWRKSFTIYHKACQLHTKDNEVQINILLHVIGEQCREVYEQFSDQKLLLSLNSVLDKYDGFFMPKKNITIERHKFFIRVQQEHESVEQYSFELNKLALTCEFKDLKDDLVRDRLICGIKDDTLRERLLRENNLTLKKSLEICNIAEMSRAQANSVKLEQDKDTHVHALRERDEESECEIHWVKRNANATCRCNGGRPARAISGAGDARATPGGPGSSGQRALGPPSRLPGTGQLAARAAPPVVRQALRHRGSQNRASVCDYCGLTHEKFVCPAYGQRCAKCQKMNHFARVCRQVFMVQDGATDQVRSRGCGRASDEWFTDLLFNENSIRFKLDTGADVNVLPLKFLSRAGVNGSDLLPTGMKLISYSGGSIKVLGECLVKVICKGQSYISKFIVADVNSPPVLGKISCEEMNLVKRILAISTIDESDRSSILSEYPEVFEGMGCLPGEYRIMLTEDARPVVHAPRKLPVALVDQIKMKLDEMLQLGVIAKVEGPTDWVNSMTVVKKSDGDIRICLDPRDLNKYIKREHFKLPTLDEITSRLSGSKMFSTLDCKQSFWQARLHEKSTDLCTFNTVFGRYKFLRLPFGISSASEVFHKRLFECFDDIEGVELFVDDLLIHGSSKSIHDRRLRQVLERCKQINVKLNREKCKIGLTEIKYLGHVISENGIKPDKDHILPILDMPTPQCTKDLERFLGLVTYVGSFIPNLSDKTYKLRELLKKETAWHWDDIHEKCFVDLKQSITIPPVLQYYSLDKPITISVDASKQGLGACLMQNGLPVCFASKSLTKTEQAYAQIEKELYACVFACEKFYTYIYGRADVTIETDHKPLISIINKPIVGAPSRLQRMLIRLQPYTFKLVYKPGKYLYIADTLSRAVAPSSGTTSTEPRDELDVQAQVCALAVSNPLTDTHFLQLQKYTKCDDEMQKLTKVITQGWPNSKHELCENLRPYWDVRDELTVAYELVWKGQKIVIPKSMRREMLKTMHIGHLGVEKTKLRAREIMFWPNMNSQIVDLISRCQPCLSHRKQNCKEPLISHEIPSRAWFKIGVDLFHFHGKHFILAIDYFSKFIVVEDLVNLTSICVIEKIKCIFSRHGIPNVVFSDNGPEFSSKLFKEFSCRWKFEHKTSSPRYPQSNGQVERAIQTIKQMLKKTHLDGSDFRLGLLEFLNTPINIDLPSPAELMYNKKLRSIIPCSPEMLVPKIINNDQTHVLLKQRQSTQKMYYDRGSRTLKQFVIGDKVKVRINENWVNGMIVNIVGPRSYSIKMHNGIVVRRNRRQIILDDRARPDSGPAAGPYDYDFDVATPTGRLSVDLTSPRHSPHCAPLTAAASASNNDSNYYVTKSGRTVKPPDRWGFS